MTPSSYPPNRPEPTQGGSFSGNNIESQMEAALIEHQSFMKSQPLAWHLRRVEAYLETAAKAGAEKDWKTMRESVTRALSHFPYMEAHP